MAINVFWDLEETVIESFDDPRLVNQERMVELVHHFSTKAIVIFSFAIWNLDDKALFECKMQPLLECLYGIQIADVLLVPDVNRMYSKKTSIFLDDTEFTALMGKHGAFVEYAKIMTKGNDTFVLIDDAVDNASFHFRDTNTTVHLVNVTNYETVGLP